MIAFYDERGKYVWVGNETAVVPGAPPPPKHPLYSVYNCYIGEVDKEQQYHNTTTGLPVDKGAAPSEYHAFDYSIKQWVDPRILTDFKDQQWESIKRARAIAIEEPLITPYGVFDADLKGVPTSQTNIADAVLLANNLAAMGHTVAIKFTLYDNSIIVLNDTAMIQVGLLLGARTQLVRDHATALRNAIDAATTIESVLAITWSSIV